jgi:hypothetical protein
MWHRLVLVTALGAGMITSHEAAEPDAKKAETSVLDRLEELGAGRRRASLVSDELVRRALSGRLVFAVRFPLYPVARVPPEPLKSQNLFAVGADYRPQLINSSKELEEYFRANAGLVKDEQTARCSGLAWLHLTEELAQDGFYKFKTVEEATKIDDVKGGKRVTARAVVMSGGNGEIVVTLSFDADGKLSRVEEKVQLKPGPRPRCHATRLLHPDPVVRSIIEQDLLIMGPAAKDYLDEQRLQASPELKQAIDRIWQRIMAGER